MLKKIRSVAIYVVGSLLLVMATDALAIEEGVASYYSDKFQGRQTASGEKYDRNKLTAAHRTLPLGSKIEITNLKNQNSVIVTINDRGPYSGSRKLDLSYAAAKELGLIASGVAPVTFDLVSPEKDRDFEKIIPLEYAPGALGLAKSQEEVIEAEEELADSGKVLDTPPRAEVEKISKVQHSHKAKKVAATSEKTAKSSNSKTHLSTYTEKKATVKADKSKLKQASLSKKLVKSDKSSAKKISKSKNKAT